ncbi:efflux RND transporter periplasmic adaptor subunit [Acidobacteria bacterium AH-259-A15]|nr:efflux RND transporter periplasmic adaptor subunit [Acidobacteria bacterium AH-259-A15]
MSWRENKTLQQLLLVGAALAVGGVVAGALVLTRTTPPREVRQVVRPVVDVVLAQRQAVPVKIKGHGTVQSTVRTQLVPEVGGRVVSVHQRMFSGGFIPMGEPLVVIDRSDYDLAVEDARAQLEQVRAALAAMETRVAEARTNLEDASRELKRIQELYERGVMSRRDADKAETGWQVAEIRFQKEKAELKTVQSRLEAARVAVRKAELNLNRTRITLPFDAVVLSEHVDAGQYVMAGQSIGEVYGTSTVEIPVPLEDQQLKWLPTVPIAAHKSPKVSSSLPRAEITAPFAGRIRRWKGHVVRTEGQIDPKSRMLNVVVRVEDPLRGLSADQPPLLPGTFVEVTIHGTTLRDVFPVPDHAIHNEDELWVVRDGRLRVQKVRIARRQRDWVYVAAGLEEGQQVIVSPMDVVTDGMEVRVASGSGDAPPPEDANPETEGRRPK